MERVTNKEELLEFFREMTLMRRMEIAADVAYKQQKIKGFLHLYNGQVRNRQISVLSPVKSPSTPPISLKSPYEHQ